MAITKYYSLIMSFIFIIAAGVLHTSFEKPIHRVSKQDVAINLKDEMILTFHGGFKRLISSILWIEAMMESDIEHYKGADLNNWFYLRFNTILKLDPLFLEAYTFGGLYLSVVKDDDLGAKDIFDRGLKLYPSNLPLAHNAIYHYHFELNQLSNALEIYMAIKNDPKTPSVIHSLMASVAFKARDLKLSQDLLREAIKTAPGKVIKKRLELRLKRYLKK